MVGGKVAMGSIQEPEPRPSLLSARDVVQRHPECLNFGRMKRRHVRNRVPRGGSVASKLDKHQHQVLLQEDGRGVEEGQRSAGEMGQEAQLLNSGEDWL